MKKTLLIIFIIALVSESGFSQKIAFVAKAPENVRLGQPFTITYELQNANAKNFNQPDFGNFQVMGMMSGHSTSYSSEYRNGKYVTETISAKTWNITLYPTEEGTFKIPSASVRANGKSYKSNSLTIKVLKGGNNNIAGNNYNNRRNKSPNRTSSSQTSGGKIFVALTTTKDEAYVGEIIGATARLYSQYYIGDFLDVQLPDFEGFWSEDLRKSQTTHFEETRLNNKPYLVALVQKKTLIPQKSGDITINPYKFVCQITDEYGIPRDRKTAVSEAKKIKIKPLPTENKPQSFRGAVGDFSLQSEINKTELNVNELITIKITVSGSGNFGLFDLPELKIPNSFELIETPEHHNYEASLTGIEGSKIYEFSYIPRGGGNFTIPAIEFSFFNPETKKYSTYKTDEYKINVSGTADESENYTAYNNEVKKLDSDINYIFDADFDIRKKSEPFFGTIKFYMFYLVPLIIFGIIIFIWRKNLKLRSNKTLFYNKQAGKISSKRLKTAKKYMTENQQEKFHEETTKALWGYLSYKLSIPQSQLTREVAKETMLQKNINSELISEFIKIIDNCEFSKYAPASATAPMQDTYEKASNIINKLESSIS